MIRFAIDLIRSIQLKNLGIDLRLKHCCDQRKARQGASSETARVQTPAGLNWESSVFFMRKSEKALPVLPDAFRFFKTQEDSFRYTIYVLETVTQSRRDCVPPP